ncbi:hypothetical protein MNBD_ALPHA06-456 [hydrothermal vent metagenome]|uniref:Uncharacterized protein n=1 Tax=hydrothermal vent metagenome TaxID=652676 RepID=A0A3B0R762_9ZZZZ
MRAWRHILTGTTLVLAMAGLAIADPVPASNALPISSDEMPWYRSFTVRSSDVSNGAFVPLKQPDIEIRASSQWGITVGLEEQDPVLDMADRMSAGAFYEFSPRFRLGGELTFTAPGDLRVSTPENSVIPVRPIDEEPMIRIESSIKF